MMFASRNRSGNTGKIGWKASLAATLCLIATMPVQAQAPAQAHSQVQPIDQPVEQRVGDVIREIGYIRLKDGTRLSYIAYRPANKKRVPVVLTYGPYGFGGAEFNDGYSQPFAFVKHGYAFVGVDLRGTTCSDGVLSMFDATIGPDGAQVVDFVGTRPWSTGSVGMWGISYPGHTQFPTSAQRPKHLKAMVAAGLTADAYSEAWRPGGMFAPSFIGFWAAAGDIPDKSSSFNCAAAQRRVEWGDQQCNPEKAVARFWQTFDEVKDHPLKDDWWKPRLLESYVDQVKTPTMIVGAWQDYETQSSGAVHLFKRLTGPKRLVMQPGGHVAADRRIVIDEALAWFDRWLKGEQNGIDKKPPVEIFWDVRTVNGRATPMARTSYASWPPPEATQKTLYLGSGEKLRDTRPTDPSSRSYLSVVGTEMFGNNKQFALVPKPLGSSFYRTEPFEADAALLGFTQLKLYFSSSEANTDIMVVLHDVDENGNVTFLQRDYLRASLRKLDPSRSTPEEQRRAFDEIQPLTPGKVYEASLSIPPLGQVIRKGHRLEFGVMSPPQIGTPDWGFVLEDKGARNTIFHGGDRASHIVLSLVPPPSLPAAANCGELAFQPCRGPATMEDLRPGSSWEADEPGVRGE